MKMKLSTKSKDYIIPEYSLTGDLLSFLTCNLQYRYQNKGNLPPSMPVQLWFGEFIHGVLEEAFLKWDSLSDDSKLNFPWDWDSEIKPIEDIITERLKVKGLHPPHEYLVNYGPENNIYSARVEKSINLWGAHLFPLIKDAEVLIKGIRKMHTSKNYQSRSEYYSINGVIDVLSSLKLKDILTEDINDSNIKVEYNNVNNINIAENNINDTNNNVDTNNNGNRLIKNKIIEYLSNNKEFMELLKNYESEEFEIIIDYKGMRRPSAPMNIKDFNKDNLYSIVDSDDYANYKNWIQHEWQILTYSWLRQEQEDNNKVICGIIFYLNELVPSTDDLLAIREDLKNNKTDISQDIISKEDLEILLNWDEKQDLPIHRDLSDKFKMDRSIRIININNNNIDDSLKRFDNVVDQIEYSLFKERNGVKIKDAWIADAEERTCNACDFKSFCNKNNNYESNYKDKNTKNSSNNKNNYKNIFTVP